MKSGDISKQGVDVGYLGSGWIAWLIKMTILSSKFWVLVFVYYSSKLIILVSKRIIRKVKWAKLVQKKKEYLKKSWKAQSIEDP